MCKGFNWLKENYEGSLLQKGVQRAGQAWDNIKAGYEKKIELIEAYQRGYSLNPKSSDFYAAALPQDIDNDMER